MNFQLIFIEREIINLIIFFFIIILQDNEYFSNFESLIYQINPDDQHIEFSVLIHMP
jgi:hypothetical protein